MSGRPDETSKVGYLETYMSGGLDIRQLRDDGGDILFRHPVRFYGVYHRYDTASHTLERASRQEWDSANGPIEQCNPRRQWSGLRLDNREFTLRFKGGAVSTAAPFVMDFGLSHGGSLAAVLTAEGPAERSDMLSGAARGAAGQHYHQFFSLEKGDYVGDAVRIPLVSLQSLRMCWSPDDQHVIYSRYNELAVVPVSRSILEKQ